jgi:hypothetical protein
MRKALALVLLVAGCGGEVGSGDAGPISGDAGPGFDAGRPRDAGERWEQLGCEPAAYAPEIGLDRFCPSAHDYVSAVGSGELEGPGSYSICADGAIVPDAGPDSGCAPAAHGWSIVQSCDSWVTGTMDEEPCFHCLEWGSRPGF